MTDYCSHPNPKLDARHDGLVMLLQLGPIDACQPLERLAPSSFTLFFEQTPSPILHIFLHSPSTIGLFRFSEPATKLCIIDYLTDFPSHHGGISKANCGGHKYSRAVCGVTACMAMLREDWRLKGLYRGH